MKFAIFALCLLLSTQGFAKNTIKNKTKPCAPDYKKFCSFLELGDSRIKDCLKEHEKELTPACRAFGLRLSQENEKRITLIANTCHEDAKKLCAENPKMKIKCLIEKKELTSQKCQAVLKTPRRE